MCALSHQHNKLACATSLAEVLLAMQAVLPPGLLGTLLLCDHFLLTTHLQQAWEGRAVGSRLLGVCVGLSWECHQAGISV